MPHTLAQQPERGPHTLFLAGWVGAEPDARLEGGQFARDGREGPGGLDAGGGPLAGGGGLAGDELDSGAAGELEVGGEGGVFLDFVVVVEAENILEDDWDGNGQGRATW